MVSNSRKLEILGLKPRFLNFLWYITVINSTFT
jgi:hypothetical protein